MKGSFNPLILNRWLTGDATEEDLREWLKEMYPSDMHGDILFALEDGGTSDQEENIDNVLDSISASPEVKKGGEYKH